MTIVYLWGALAYKLHQNQMYILSMRSESKGSVTGLIPTQNNKSNLAHCLVSPWIHGSFTLSKGKLLYKKPLRTIYWNYALPLNEPRKQRSTSYLSRLFLSLQIGRWYLPKKSENTVSFNHFQSCITTTDVLYSAFHFYPKNNPFSSYIFF